jgi:hypothetical protein
MVLWNLAERAVGCGDRRSHFGERTVAHAGTAEFTRHRDAPQAARHECVKLGPRQPPFGIAQRGLRCELRREALRGEERLRVVGDQVGNGRSVRRCAIASLDRKINGHVQFHECRAGST